jgi:hypothetical protein
MTYGFMWHCICIGPPHNVQNVLALVDRGAKPTLLFSNPTKFQGPTVVTDGYGRRSPPLWRHK